MKEQPDKLENIEYDSEKILNTKYSSGYVEVEKSKVWNTSPYQLHQDLESGKGLLIFQKLNQISGIINYLVFVNNVLKTLIKIKRREIS